MGVLEKGKGNIYDLKEISLLYFELLMKVSQRRLMSIPTHVSIFHGLLEV
jgi:hypothetical protein